MEKVKLIKDSQWLVEVFQEFKFSDLNQERKSHTLVALIKLDAESAQEAVDKVQKVIDASLTKDIYIGAVSYSGVVTYDVTKKKEVPEEAINVTGGNVKNETLQLRNLR